MAQKINMWLELTGTLSGYVYQLTRAGSGNIPGDKTNRRQKRRHVIPHNPKTIAQGFQRGRFALGVTAWHGLTALEKAQWKTNGSTRGLGAFQMFMRIWCLSTALPTATEWDGGLTTWDAGATGWI